MANRTDNRRVPRERRHKHIMKHLKSSSERPRLIVFRSAKHIYAQIVDDDQHRTLVTASTLSKGIQEDLAKAKTKTAKAKVVGAHVAALAKEKNISQVVFDRAGYMYHGRVKALADGARESGLIF